jgi:acyl carrier protein
MNTIIEPERFLKIFCDQFEESAVKNISLKAAFKQIQGWSSLQALIITVAIHDEWGISFSDEDLRNSQTINDLFEIAKTKLHP